MITRAEALEIVTNTLDDRVSGPSTQEILEALGLGANAALSEWEICPKRHASAAQHLLDCP